MCGITGIWAFNEVGRFQMTNLIRATESLAHRGPDDQGTFNDHFVGLGHRRLSIIDTSAAGHQPMSAQDGRYQLVFNGEIYNYQELRKKLANRGVTFDSASDTEVLLKLLIHEGKSALNQLEGFFALGFYDTKEKYLLVARDRLGIKPVLYYQDEFKFLFASEMQAILSYGLDKNLNHQALHAYLQFNYTPAPLTMVEGVKKLPPGHLIEISSGRFEMEQYYDLPTTHEMNHNITYDEAKTQLHHLMEESVEQRLIADVPLGCFLSGGIDSSVVTAIASQKTDKLATFSIGFADNPFFDETHYAELVARKFNTQHTTFNLTNDEIFSHLDDIITAIDEPFADSSAVPVYILSKKVRQYITVALSGDGADEIFSGYNKHAAWRKIEDDGFSNALINAAAPMAAVMPKSRSGKWGNLMRQILRFSRASRLSHADRYRFLAAFASSAEATALLKADVSGDYDFEAIAALDDYQDINDLLRVDTQFVLPNDMLKKVDLMSMTNGLEVRVPFLHHKVVDFVFSLPAEFKLDATMRKKILQDTYQKVLPAELYQRPKKGFEMPVLDWLRGPLKYELNQCLFNRDLIEEQGVFQWESIEILKNQMQSSSPEDSHARIWALYVFQKWYGKYFTS